MRRAVVPRIVAAAAALTAVVALLPTAAMAARPDRVETHQSRYGTIAVDGRGFTLYAFTRDGTGKSTCYGACAAAWPPFLVSSRPLAGTGIQDSRLGTRRRTDGRLQATLLGRPLYYYVGDRNAYDIFCQNVREFGGDWLILRPSGKLVR